MTDSSQKRPDTKSRLHPRNKHRQRYDLEKLVESTPELKDFLVTNKHGDQTVAFADPNAVKALNKALLQHHYQIEYWDIPEGYLCPPVPGRADYLHHIADLLANRNENKEIPKGTGVMCLDIGVGANCVYPIIGRKEYDWTFIGSDIDETAINSAKSIVEKNPFLAGQVDIRHQENPPAIFEGIIHPSEMIDITICNPPFHASEEEAQANTARKVKNLHGQKKGKPDQNFGGVSNELWVEGGEKAFVQQMITESRRFKHNVRWFSTLVSRESRLPRTYAALREVKAADIKTIPMGQGNKSSRIVAWTFMTRAAQKEWIEKRREVKK